ncbi:hypothetical protein [Tritonibacter horizontis]|uniref:Uncharacterized protein n=1 Tax=Tritonibacter horizontis TaxID=1768241 RepID=A0A132C3A7_9RHOB|nr:hypothetical protein [Tritonibacter horizontis]KUP94712.1 hypothetical protein TRIHO_04060 [Tritonibacter horizontis]
MPETGKEPREEFPVIGTEEIPAIFFDGDTLLLCYEVAPIDGGGLAILEFSDVLEFKVDPMNVDELSDAAYPVSAWNVTEICGSEKAARWAAMDARYWSLSFSDLTLTVLFDTVKLAGRTPERCAPHTALKHFMSTTAAAAA